MRRAFTLIELLVVIALIALLVGLLMPVLGQARATARQAACLANMRSIGQAHGVYLVESDGRMLGTSHGTSWMAVLRGYSQSLLLRSPLDGSPYFEQTDDNGRLRQTSYALSYMVSPDNADPRAVAAIDRVPLPAATVHAVLKVFDVASGASTEDHVHPALWDSLLFDPAVLAANEVQTHAYAGQPGTPDAVAGYVYLDGHAAAEPFGELFVDGVNNQFFPLLAR
ncbi:MAG: type II secretion system protein [Planctomycetota bacterium]